MEQNGSLLLRSCLRFRRKIRPSSVLRLYDLISACSSTSALIDLRLFPSGYGAGLIFHLRAGAVIPTRSCCNNEFALPFFQLFAFLWRLCLACEVSVTLLLWATGFVFDSQTFAVLESNAFLQLMCFSNSVQQGNK